MDITTGYHFGGSYSFPGQVSTTILEGITPILHVGAYSPDQYSSVFAISTLPDAPFNLTYAPKGPNLYQAASGAYIWGSGYAYTVDAPGGKVVTIVPETSMTWFDMQWGPSYAPGGWHAFVILLANGIKIQVSHQSLSELQPEQHGFVLLPRWASGGLACT
jgi:hypothetical protein